MRQYGSRCHARVLGSGTGGTRWTCAPRPPHERYSPRGLNIIGVAYGEEPSGLRKFLAANPVPFEVAVGADSTYEKFALTSIPTAVLVDENGRIVERWSGYFTTEELAEKISPKLPGRTGNSEE